MGLSNIFTFLSTVNSKDSSLAESSKVEKIPRYLKCDMRQNLPLRFTVLLLKRLTILGQVQSIDQEQAILRKIGA